MLEYHGLDYGGRRRPFLVGGLPLDACVFCAFLYATSCIRILYVVSAGLSLFVLFSAGMLPDGSCGQNVPAAMLYLLQRGMVFRAFSALGERRRKSALVLREKLALHRGLLYLKCRTGGTQSDGLLWNGSLFLFSLSTSGKAGNFRYMLFPVSSSLLLQKRHWW